MRSPWLRLVASLPMLICLSVSAHAQPARQTFLGFPDFVADLKSAAAASYVGAPGAMVESAAAFEAIRQHLLSLYDGVEVGHSFLLDDFMYVDCIPIMQQPTVRLLGLTGIAQPPSISPFQGLPRPPRPLSSLELGLSDKFGNEVKCAPGTIPMRRLTLEELCHARTLQEYFQKEPPAKTSSTTSNYRYQVAFPGTGNLNNLGAETWINVWYPTVNGANGDHSISQMWLVGEGSGPLQTAEVGWYNPWFYKGTYVSALFIYYTNNDYAPNSGCYNLGCAGFVQLSNTVVLGAPDWPGPSMPGGQQVIFDAEFYLGYNPPQNVWWLASGCDACFIGYYPTSIYNGGRLSQYSDFLEFGGEVVAANNDQFPPMGSGAFANAGAGFAAFQENIYYWPITGGILPAPLHGSSPTRCYSLQFFNQSVNSFYFGGPGGTNCP